MTVTGAASPHVPRSLLADTVLGLAREMILDATRQFRLVE